MLTRAIKLLRSVVPEFVQAPVRNYLRSSRTKAYQGSDVVCNMCQATFSMFAPHGLAQRKNARCLNCGSLERHRLIWKYLNERTDFLTRPRLRLLHFAPEKVFINLFSKMAHIDYVPCDLEPDRYQVNVSNLKVAAVDITAIPFPENSFDVIICSHVLEHIPDDHLAMTELRRVMKANGWGIFQVPIDYSRAVTYEDFSITDPIEREKHFGQADHVRYYGRDYRDRLANAGLNVDADDFVKTLTDGERFKFGLDKDETIYFCRKG